MIGKKKREWSQHVQSNYWDVIKRCNYLSVGKPVVYSAFIAWNGLHIMAIPFLRYYMYNPIILKVSRRQRSPACFSCPMSECVPSINISDSHHTKYLHTVQIHSGCYLSSLIWSLLIISSQSYHIFLGTSPWTWY